MKIKAFTAMGILPGLSIEEVTAPPAVVTIKKKGEKKPLHIHMPVAVEDYVSKADFIEVVSKRAGDLWDTLERTPL